MSTNIFVNLPVKDLKKTKAFFSELGYSFNPQFTDDNAACMVISDTIYAMLLVEPFFQTFTPKAIVDAKKNTEVLISLSMPSRQAVTDIVEKAVRAGGRTYAEPKDHGFMLQHGFEDLDGHIWEFAFMEPSYIQ